MVSRAMTRMKCRLWSEICKTINSGVLNFFFKEEVVYELAYFWANLISFKIRFFKRSGLSFRLE